MLYLKLGEHNNHQILEMKNKLIILAICTFILCPSLLLADQPLQIQGVGGKVDPDHLGPILSVSATYADGVTKILADAVVNDEKYKSFPIQFDFYVNRNLVASQIRSTELPGPIGLDVPASTATPPLNYAVIAKMLTPDRIYNTAIYGAVKESDSGSTTLDCTITSDANDDSLATPYVANAVSTSRVDATTFSISFEGSSVEAGTSAKVSGNVATTSTTASGTISIEIDSIEETVAMSGTASSTGDSLTAVDLSSVDGAYTLKCS